MASGGMIEFWKCGAARNSPMTAKPAERLAEIERESERLLDEMTKAVGTPRFGELQTKVVNLLKEAAELKGIKL